MKQTGASENKLDKASRTALDTLLGMHEGEKVLIIANLTKEILPVAESFYHNVFELGGRAVLLYQDYKTKLDLMEPAVLMALKSDPEITISLTTESVGIDYEAVQKPYILDGKVYDHYFYYLMAMKKTRTAWCPNITSDIFERTVNIDYKEMWRRSAFLQDIFDRAVSLHVTTPAGTDLQLDITGCKALLDDGHYNEPGLGGNLPAGEVFISPRVEAVEGTAVIDGSFGLDKGVVKDVPPMELKIEKGHVTEISENEGGNMLSACLARGLKKIRELVDKGIIPPERGTEYQKYNDHIGEFGIGLNPAARISGNMLEDEKVLGTCHIAIGDDYNGKANTLLHLDSLMKNPTIIARFEDGTEKKIWPE